jgi:2-polyprenyl-6-methoxyphenol hydroxylase-like FAD-dependent oxidoreductase
MPQNGGSNVGTIHAAFGVGPVGCVRLIYAGGFGFAKTGRHVCSGRHHGATWVANCAYIHDRGSGTGSDLVDPVSAHPNSGRCPDDGPAWGGLRDPTSSWKSAVLAHTFRNLPWNLDVGRDVAARPAYSGDISISLVKAHKIAVVGAGIGGLAGASLLTKDRHAVTVFDQFDKPRPLGSGLVIQPVGLAVLGRIGVAAKACQLGNRIHQMVGLEAESGRRVLDVSYARKGVDSFGLAIHRASLFQCLYDKALESGVHLQTSCKIILSSITQEGRFLYTEDGQSHGPFDLVIDASGAKSALSPILAKPLPYGAIWGTVPWPKTQLPIDQLSQRYRRADRMAGVLPIGRMPDDTRPLAAIFWSLSAREMKAWQESPLGDWKAKAIDLWPEFEPFLATIENQTDMTPATYSHGTLRRPYMERLVFIGDSAHRASPQLGQGANMALLDALALAIALRSNEFQDALPAYAQMRRWHAKLYQTFSWAFTPQYQSDSRILPILRDRILMPISAIPPMPFILNRLVSGDLIPPLAGQIFP